MIILGGRDSPSSKTTHTLTLDKNPITVTLANLTLISNGSEEENGIAPASLNVVNSHAELLHVIVSANKTVENPAREAILREGSDQEGVAVYGPRSHVRVYQSLLAGNFHTGITLYEDASAEIIGSLVKENGWSPWTTRFEGIGHGISTLGTDFCYAGNNQVSVWNTIVVGNSGTGILLRGDLQGGAPTIMQNTVVDNLRGGIQLRSLRADGAAILLANNLIDRNGAPGGIVVSPAIALTGGSTLSLYHNSSTRNQGGDYVTNSVTVTLLNNLPSTPSSFTDPLFDLSNYSLLPTSPLLGQGWRAISEATPAPDISSYANDEYAEYRFNSTTLQLWCQLYTVLERLGTPTNAPPCEDGKFAS